MYLQRSKNVKSIRARGGGLYGPFMIVYAKRAEMSNMGLKSCAHSGSGLVSGLDAPDVAGFLGTHDIAAGYCPVSWVVDHAITEPGPPGSGVGDVVAAVIIRGESIGPHGRESPEAVFSESAGIFFGADAGSPVVVREASPFGIGVVCQVVNIAIKFVIVAGAAGIF